MKNYIYTYGLTFIVPLFLMIAAALLLNKIGQSIHNKFLSAALLGFLGLALSIIIYFTIRYFQINRGLQPLVVGNFPNLLIGLSIGVAVSVISGIGYGLANGYSFKFDNLLIGLHINTLMNIFPALCEEIIFRGGLVHIVIQHAGNFWGLAAGSIPFGVLHIIGVLFGQTVTFAQIIGITAAGLMLSLVYVNFGIMGSFACHLVWNSLVGSWIKVYGIESKGAVSALEGSWVTIIVLLSTSFLLFVLWRSNPKFS